MPVKPTKVKSSNENPKPAERSRGPWEIAHGHGYVRHALDVTRPLNGQVEGAAGLDGGGDTDPADAGLGEGKEGGRGRDDSGSAHFEGCKTGWKKSSAHN